MSTNTNVPKDKYRAEEKRYNNFQTSTTNPYGTNYQRYYSPTQYQTYGQQTVQQAPIQTSQVVYQQQQQPVYTSQVQYGPAVTSQTQKTNLYGSQVYQSYKGESRYQTIPIERKVIEYEQVPVEKTYVDQEVIEYQTEYVPRLEYDTYTEQVPVRSVEYVPVQRIDYVPQERIDYVPQQRQVERVEYDIREVPMKRGVQQSQLPMTSSQVGAPFLSSSQQINYYPQQSFVQPTTYGYQQQYQQQYVPSTGAQAYGQVTSTATKPEYAKKEYAKDTTSKK